MITLDAEMLFLFPKVLNLSLNCHLWPPQNHMEAPLRVRPAGCEPQGQWQQCFEPNLVYPATAQTETDRQLFICISFMFEPIIMSKSD